MRERDDQEFVERVRSAWGRPELSDSERAVLDVELRERLRAPRPRRWALPAGAVAAVAAAVMVVLSVRQPTADAGGWIDALADAQAVVRGEHAYSETFALYEDDAETDVVEDPVWDVSADAAWGSSESLDLGYEYEVLAYWLAPPADGDSAAQNPGSP